jgi:uncharacterized protein (TIGR02996 family)
MTKPATSTKAADGEVAAFVEARRWEEALAALLRRWQDERAPELAELIERVSQQLPAPTVGNSWRAAAAAAARGNLSALLASMTDGKFADSLERIRALESLPPDPRIAAALTRFILTPPFTAQSSREFWASLYDQLADRHADPRTLAAVRPVADSYQSIFGQTKIGESMQRRARALVDSLEERFPSTPSADVAALAALVPEAKGPEPKRTKSGHSLDDLLAAVYESPDDDGARLVYADALLEAGDPRGDFITLQWKRHRGEPLTPAEEKQEAALQKKHAKAWLGPLYDVLHTTQLVFRRGFLYGAQIRPVAKAIPAARNHPAWTTVRELNMSTGGTNERGASLITQPNARHIRVLINVVYMVLDELVASTDIDRALEVLHISWLPLTDEERGGRGQEQADRAWARLLDGKAVPRLRELRLGYEAAREPEAVAALWDSPLVKRLEAVRMKANGYDPKRWLDEAARRATKRLRIELDFGPVLFTARDDGRAELRAAPSRYADDRLWEKLPKALDSSVWRTITVATDAATDAQLQALAKALPKATITRAPLSLDNHQDEE